MKEVWLRGGAEQKRLCVRGGTGMLPLAFREPSLSFRRKKMAGYSEDFQNFVIHSVSPKTTSESIYPLDAVLVTWNRSQYHSVMVESVVSVCAKWHLSNGASGFCFWYRPVAMHCLRRCIF